MASIGGVSRYGTVFKITASGTLTTLHSFDDTDGESPGRLIQATDENLYGTTAFGGVNSLGTLFKITLGGTLTTLHSFCLLSDCTDGEIPAALVQDTDGTFYGTTANGGVDSDGMVFSLGVGLRPFVKPVLTFGKVGSAVGILGTNLTGATSVTFNGVQASFRVISASGIGATVPTGATTGPVQVVTPSGTLTSNVNFQVLP